MELTVRNISFLTNGPYNLILGSGECCGLSGASGVGKSQFLRAVADVLAHDGECLLGSTPCLSFTPQNWRKTVALIPAESFWWYDTVGPHVPVKTDVKPILLELLERLGFTEDVLNWQIARLSTGERQRLSLVRTLVTKPQVLLLDEPTSGLDPAMTSVVEEIISELCETKQSSCLWVSHDLAQLDRISDRVFKLELNRLVELKP